MNEPPPSPRILTGTDLARRAFLGTSVLSLGSIALSSLMARRGLAEAGGGSPLAPGEDTPAYKLGSATAKRVIMIFAAGGLSQLDLFDEKPLLNKRRGEELPDSVRQGQRITGVTEKQGALPVVGSCFKFKPYGKSGLRMSELFREMGAFADDICLVRSMQTDHVLHEAAMSILFTGTMQLGRPSWGSWVTYALGAENKDLPEFVVMLSGMRDGGSPPHPRMWHNGYLPGRYQGCPFRSGKEPVFFVSNPEGIDAKTRRRILDAVKALNEREADDDRRSGSDGPHPRLRDGGPHADERARADGPLERARRRARAVRRGAGQGDASPTTASWPGDLPSAASASSSSWIAAGTTTTISPSSSSRRWRRRTSRSQRSWATSSRVACSKTRS